MGIGEAFENEAASDDARGLTILRGKIAVFNAGLANYKHIRHISVRKEKFTKTPTKKIIHGRNI